MSLRADIGDIVQIDPEMETFGGCMAVIKEVKANGRIMAYVQSAGVPGQQYIFLNAGKYEPTGGRAVWIVGGES